MLPFVSLCTPTFNRRPFIPMMIQCFMNQDYPKDRIEWIIVDDGTDHVGDLLKNVPSVEYYHVVRKMTLGEKRNFCNSQCKGDFILYVDDDDFYPPDRISYSVKMLQQNPEYLIAGSSEMYVYFKEIQKMYTIGPFNRNHATAATFAFRKELLQITSFDDKEAVGEEKKFLKDKDLKPIPVLQLDPRKTILVFSHQHNSCSKLDLLKILDPKVFKETYVDVKDFISDPMIYNFFMREIDDLLFHYTPGSPLMKPDCLQQSIKIKERTEAVDKHNQYQTTIQSKRGVESEKYEKKINDLTLIISQLLEENASYKKRLNLTD